jgi:hypothetical protein
MLAHGQRGTRERSQRDGFAFAVKESMELGAAAVHAACKFRFRDVFTLHEFIELLGQLMQNALRELIGAVLKRKVQPRPSDCPRWARVTLKFSMALSPLSRYGGTIHALARPHVTSHLA